MEGGSQDVVISAKDANDFGVLKELSTLSSYGSDMGRATWQVFDIVKALIGEAVVEGAFYTNDLSESRYRGIKGPAYAKAVVVSGWRGFGKERLVKYVTKTLMRAKLFDTLIWMMRPKEDLTSKNFQRLVALGLGIPLDDRLNDEDPDDQFDSHVSKEIHNVLQHRRVLLVHNGNVDFWHIYNFNILGIPGNGDRNYTLIMAASTEHQGYDKHFKIEDFSDIETYYLLREEGEDILSSLHQRGLHIAITPVNVGSCILYFLNFHREIEIEAVLRSWYANGCFGDDKLDLETVFEQGKILLHELQARNFIKVGNKYISPTIREHGFGEKLETFFQSPGYYSIRSLQTYEALNNPIDDQIHSSQHQVRYLNLRNCKHLFQVSNLSAFVQLEMLDLSNTLVEEIPNHLFESLKCLRLLDLSGCFKMSYLPSSIASLLNLEQLFLSRCENLIVLPSFTQPLQKLKVLDLSSTKLLEIPEQFLKSFINLKDLDLSFNSHLASLPKTISNLVNLKKLNIASCPHLMISLTSQHLPLSLVEIHLSNFSSLEDINNVSSSSAYMLPNLRVLNISSARSRSISFKNYSSLETIILQSNTIEFLDLSGTKITKFPLEGNPHLKSLKRLDLLNVKHIRRVDWEKVGWLPQEVNWDQRGDESTTKMHMSLTKWRQEGNGGIFMSLSNFKILRAIPGPRFSQLLEKYLTRFLIYICPPMKRQVRGTPDTKKLPFQYKNLCSRFKPDVPCYERCLEVGGGSDTKFVAVKIEPILTCVNFLYLHDATIDSISFLYLERMEALRQFWIEKCHTTEVLFDIKYVRSDECILRYLEKLRISNLMKLRTMCLSPSALQKGSFGSLRHLQLEYCPRIVNVFSSGVCLEKLEVLELKFCSRLKEIFSGKHGQGSLGRLHTIFLLELPVLKSIVHDITFASLKKAYIKECPKLHKLPIGGGQKESNVEAAIVIKGEPKWWKQLEWESKDVRRGILFKPIELPRRTTK